MAEVVRGLILEGSDIQTEGAPNDGRDPDFSMDWGGRNAESKAPASDQGPAPDDPVGEQHSWRGAGVAWASPLPGCSLLGAALCALGSAAVVPDEAAETHSHSRVTVIHGHHGHLLSRWPVRQAQAADVGLREEKAQKASAWAPTGGTCHLRTGAEDIGRPRVDSLVLN